MAWQPQNGFTLVRFAPSKTNKQKKIPLEIFQMDASDAQWWDDELRPLHRKLKVRRADHNWKWRKILPFAHLSALLNGRQCIPLVIWAPNDHGAYMRVGMSILIEPYPQLETTSNLESVYVWFIAGADEQILRSQYGMTDPPALGRIMLDNAMVVSFTNRHGGAIGLHAAPAGGDGLVNKYLAWGLANLPEAAPLPAKLKRNDGRYFYAGPATAISLMQNLNAYR